MENEENTLSYQVAVLLQSMTKLLAGLVQRQTAVEVHLSDCDAVTRQNEAAIVEVFEEMGARLVDLEKQMPAAAAVGQQLTGIETEYRKMNEQREKLDQALNAMRKSRNRVH
jgi:hypothetical protein